MQSIYIDHAFSLPYWYNPNIHAMETEPFGQTDNHNFHVHSPLPGQPCDNGQSTIEAMWLNLTKGCNLRCDYCFTTDSAGSSEIMSNETAEECVEFMIREALKDSANRPRNIIFFGGEPLLNFKTLRHTVLYSQQRCRALPVEFKFMLSTNGALLEKSQIQFLAENKITVQLSLDGPEEIHDLVRKKASGEGSWKETMRAVNLLINSYPQKLFSLRPTITDKGPGLLWLARYFSKLGVKTIFFKNLISKSESRADGIPDWLEEQRGEMAPLAKFIADSYHHAGISIHPFIGNAQRLLSGVKSEKACSAGFSTLSISPDGSVYPCHRYDIDESRRVASNLENFKDTAKATFREQNRNTKINCDDCWAKWFCEKGCPASIYFSGADEDDFGNGFCDFKKFEAEVSLKVALSLKKSLPAGSSV